MTHLSRRQFLASAAATGMLAATPAILLPARAAAAASHATITAGKRSIEVGRRAATVFGLTQPDGRHGIVMDAGQRFRVRLENRIGAETAIHWHGLTPPWRQDGVAGISQELILPGATQDYDFPVTRPGTFWMHSHAGLQEQLMLAAPLIVRDPAEAQNDVQEIVVLFHDFTFRDPEEILAGLRGEGHGSMPGMEASSAGQMDHGGMHGTASDGGMRGMDTGGKAISRTSNTTRCWPMTGPWTTPRCSKWSKAGASACASSTARRAPTCGSTWAVCRGDLSPWTGCLSSLSADRGSNSR